MFLDVVANKSVNFGFFYPFCLRNSTEVKKMYCCFVIIEQSIGHVQLKNVAVSTYCLFLYIFMRPMLTFGETTRH